MTAVLTAAKLLGMIVGVIMVTLGIGGVPDIDSIGMLIISLLFMFVGLVLLVFCYGVL